MEILKSDTLIGRSVFPPGGPVWMGLLALFLSAFAVPVASAEATAKPLVDWHLQSLDQPCAGDCRVMVFAGRFLNTAMEDIFFDPVPPWDWRWRDSHFLGLAFSRRLATIAESLDVEAEAGLGQRFGDLDETEGWLALYFRWTRFPWNHRLKTTVAVSTGLNVASGISQVEVDRGEVGYGKRVLHYFSPELTFSLPNKEHLELVFRIHHRSGGYGLVSDVTGGAQYGTVGIRYHY